MLRTIVILILIGHSVFSQNWEYQTISRLQGNRTESTDKFWNTLSQSADYTAIGLPVLVTATGLLSSDKTLTKQGLTQGLSVLGSYGVGYILKKSINRQRPYQVYNEFTPAIYKTSGSMPSGSTTMAFTTATNITLMKPKWYVIAPAYGYAAAVGFSRIKLAEHYPTDVLAGAALGTASAILSKKLSSWINKK
jgi:membrane-associated phospholipid phosphatase